VSVETSRIERAIPDAVRRRLLIAELLWRHTMRADAALMLPYSVAVEADDRRVTVDSEAGTAYGMRIEGEPEWVGMMRLGDATVKITTTSADALSLRICADASSVPEMPPRHH
jgi:hypothetical protein